LIEPKSGNNSYKRKNSKRTTKVLENQRRALARLPNFKQEQPIYEG